METKLYVGNLPYSATEEELRALFERAGTVTSVTIIADRDSGRSRGFGFIEMSTQAEAEEAIKLLNDYNLNEREIKVNMARPREEQGGRFGDQRGYRGGRRSSRGGKGKRQY
jgi:cold-inducible RNA-binding protein